MQSNRTQRPGCDSCGQPAAYVTPANVKLCTLCAGEDQGQQLGRAAAAAEFLAAAVEAARDAGFTASQVSEVVEAALEAAPGEAVREVEGRPFGPDRRDLVPIIAGES